MEATSNAPRRAFRGKFRHSYEKPEPFTPGKVDKVEFELPDVWHE